MSTGGMLDGWSKVDRKTESRTTHFGYRQVPVEEKARLVGAIFDSLANRYDLLNDMLSLGVHRLWRRFAVELSGVGPGQCVLDLAGGTGELTARLARLAGSRGLVVLAEINETMLGLGRERLARQDTESRVQLVQADAENAPFVDECFDCVTIAFGLRNVTDQEAALSSMNRVLKPGAPAVILEFSHPVMPGFRPFYDFYSFLILPVLGWLVTGNGGGYRYLAESIRVHPDQETLKGMMARAGFERCDYFNLSGGVAAVHRGFKPPAATVVGA
jgi:demethylmenaquinone methyltransferase/2-methoxy-6-polyprenyl-1,4-benzoquinol methylase